MLLVNKPDNVYINMLLCYGMRGYVFGYWVEADQLGLKAKRPRESQIDCRSKGRTSQVEGLKNVPDRPKAR